METIIRDKYLQKLIDRRENGLIKIVTGIRRCGKSFLLFNLFYNYLLSQGIKEENIIRISLDDDEDEDLRDCAKLYEYIRERIKNNEDMHYIFIDEVQYAIKKEDLKKEYLPLYGVLNGLLHKRNVDVYVTGSNSKLLSKDVMTEFRGRGDEVRISPLTFKEYFDYVGGNKREAFEEYSLYGGLPFVLSKSTHEDKAKYLHDLFNEVYLKDIMERYSINMPDVVEVLTDDLYSSIGSLTNANKIANALKSNGRAKVENVTIATYLNYLEESFLFSQAKRYDVKGKKYFSYPYKYYCTDIGLRNARLNFRQQEQTHIMENIIYNELISRGYSVDVGVVPITSRTKNGKSQEIQYEIDFVINRGMDRFYIQSALYLDNEEKKNKELRPLIATKDFFKKIIVTKDEFHPWLDDLGILHIGIYDFLLKEEYLR